MPVRYAYGVTTALLLAGATATIVSGYPAGAQVAQNEAPIQASPPGGAPMSFANLAEKLAPAVVNISTRQRVPVPANPFGGLFGPFFGQRPGQGGQTPQTREAQSLGSGFIISADGYIVTNNHVVAPGGRGATVESITVTLPDRSEYEAKLVARDEASDIAVLKIQRTSPFPFVKFGDSTKTRVGDWIVAIGNPFGLGGTTTAGIVSAVYRNTGFGGAYDRYLQTDAAINSGNSGGPMFDLNGNVIGINNAIISPNGGSVGIGFAIPAELAQPIVEKLIKGEKIERGYLGVAIAPITDDLAASLGIPKGRGEFIQRVEPNEAAAKAGLKGGDVVLKIGDKDVTPDNTLSFIIANMRPGTRVPLQILRDGKPQTVQVTVGTRPAESTLAQDFSEESQGDFPEDQEDTAKSPSAEQLGVATLALTPQIRRQLNIGDDVQGVVVSAVDANGDAAAKGLARRDIILTIDGKVVTTPAQLDAAVTAAKAANKSAVLLRVQRGNGQPAFVPVRLKR